jgi:hypothetical protein
LSPAMPKDIVIQTWHGQDFSDAGGQAGLPRATFAWLLPRRDGASFRTLSGRSAAQRWLRRNERASSAARHACGASSSMVKI